MANESIHSDTIARPFERKRKGNSQRDAESDIITVDPREPLDGGLNAARRVRDMYREIFRT